jgi:hypothetical protein
VVLAAGLAAPPGPDGCLLLDVADAEVVGDGAGAGLGPAADAPGRLP